MTERPGQTRVLVFGAGAVGSLLGGILADSGFDVTLLGRADAGGGIDEQGLHVDLPDRSITARPRFVQRISEIEHLPDIVLLTTRAYSVAGLIPALRQLAGEQTTLVTLQNGIGTEELITQELPGVNHLAGSLTLSAGWLGPGQVASTSRSGGIALAPVSDAADISILSDLFIAAGIRTVTLDDYRSMKWSKLVLNMMANAVPALLDWPPARVYQDQATFTVERAALLEAFDVIRAEGSALVSLPGFPVPALPWIFRLPDSLARRILLSRVSGGRGDKMPSLLLDLQAGRSRTEARWLYGAVVKAGERSDIRTPVNRRLLRLMEGVTTNDDLRAAFRDRPELLVRNVALGTRANTSIEGHYS